MLHANAGDDFGDDTRPRLATDGKGNWVVVWYSRESFGAKLGNDSDIFSVSSSDNGRTWSEPVPVNNNAWNDFFGDFNPDIATDGKGLWVVTYYTFNDFNDRIGNDGDLVFVRSTDNGHTWSDPIPLFQRAYHDFMLDASPRIASDRKGTWMVVWWSHDWLDDTIGVDADILYSRSTDGAQTWSEPLPVNTNAFTDFDADFNPHLTYDREGTWMVVWDSRDTLGGLLGSDRDILCAVSEDNGVSFRKPVWVNAHAPTDSGNDADPIVATDGLGTWITTWWSADTLGGTIGQDSDVLVSRSTDKGKTWSEAVWINPNADGDNRSDLMPVITTDRLGIWLIVWQYYGDGDIDIWGRVSTDAGKTWRGFFQLNTNFGVDVGGDLWPTVLGDGSGNWVGVWESYDDLGGTKGFDHDILFTRARFGNAVPQDAWRRYR